MDNDIKETIEANDTYNRIAAPLQLKFVELAKQCKSEADFVTLASCASILFSEANTMLARRMCPLFVEDRKRYLFGCMRKMIEVMLNDALADLDSGRDLPSIPKQR